MRATRPRYRVVAGWAVAVGVVLPGIAGCGATASQVAPRPAGSVAGSSVDAEISPADVEAFVGGGLEFTDRGDFGLDRAQLVTTDDAPGGRVLRVAFPAGSASPSAGGDGGGMQAYLRLPGEPVDVLELEYQVRFAPGFDFVKGGKLPGLYGGTVTGGRQIPDGTDGFSTRYMWRAGGDGEVYAYLPTSQEHGTSIGRGCWSFPTGRWTTVHQRVQLNTPGRADGRITVRQDGQVVLDRGELEFRTTDELRIDGLFFSTFFGGSDSSWASPVDQHADFAGFTVSPGSTQQAPPEHGSNPDCGTAENP